MCRSRTLGLQWRLLLLVMLLVVPLMALHVYQAYRRVGQRVDVELDLDAKLAEAVSAAFTNGLDNLWDEELALGTSFLSQDEAMSDRAIRFLLQTQLSAHPSTAAIAWIDSADGHVVAETQPGWSGPVPGALEPSLQRVGAGEIEVLSNVFSGGDNRTPVVAVSRAIFRSQQHAGTIVAYVNPLLFGESLPIGRSANGAFALVDANGNLAYVSGPNAQGHVGKPVGKDAPSLEALQGRVGLSRSYGSHNPRIGVAVPVPRVGWAASATTPTRDVMAATRRETLQDLLTLILVASVSLLAAWLTANHFLRPLRRLQDAARAISLGDLDARVGLQGTDELASTAQTFDRMAEDIQGLIQQRDRFLQMAAHELRNPMSSVKGALSLIRRRLAAGKPIDNLASLTSIMEGEIDWLSHLLNALLEAFRVQEGGLPLRLEAVNVWPVVQAAVATFSTASERHRFRVENVAPGAPWVLGDAGRLEDVLRNLYSNAIKYAPDGGEVLTRVTSEGGRVLVSVRDNGVGIPPEQLPHVFERFFRCSSTTGSDPGGLGLGLYICQDIVTRHGGRIWAESTPGQGTTFFIDLPQYLPEGESYERTDH